jgi:hypothetical protein
MLIVTSQHRCQVSIAVNVYGAKTSPSTGPAVPSLHSPEALWKRRPPLCHPDRSVAQWRDLQFSGPPVEMFFDRRIMGLRPAPGAEKTVSLVRSKQKCHPDRSVAKWRDLLFIICGIESEWKRRLPFVIPSEAEGSAVPPSTIRFQWKRRPPLCHPDRSVAQWRDLQFNGPALEISFDQN